MEDYNEIITFLEKEYTPYELILGAVESIISDKQIDIRRYEEDLNTPQISSSRRNEINKKLTRLNNRLDFYTKLKARYNNKANLEKNATYRAIIIALQGTKQVIELLDTIRQNNINIDEGSQEKYNMQEFLELLGTSEAHKKQINKIVGEDLGILRTAKEQMIYLQGAIKAHIDERLEITLTEAFLGFERTPIRGGLDLKLDEDELRSVLREELGLNTRNPIIDRAIERSKNREQHFRRRHASLLNNYFSTIAGLLQHFNQPSYEHLVSGLQELENSINTLEETLAGERKQLRIYDNLRENGMLLALQEQINVQNKILQEIELLTQAKTKVITETKRLETLLGDINTSDKVKQDLINLCDTVRNQEVTYSVPEIDKALGRLNKSLTNCSLTSQEREIIEAKIKTIKDQLPKCKIGQKLMEEISKFEASCFNKIPVEAHKSLKRKLARIKSILTDNISIDKKQFLIQREMQALQENCDNYFGEDSEQSKSLEKYIQYFSEYLQGFGHFDSDKSIEETKELVTSEKNRNEEFLTEVQNYSVRVKELSSRIRNLRGINRNYIEYRKRTNNIDSLHAEKDYFYNPYLISLHLSNPNEGDKVLAKILEDLNAKQKDFLDKYHNDKYNNDQDTFDDMKDLLSDAVVLLLAIKPNMNERELKAYFSRFGTSSSIHIDLILESAKEKYRIRRSSSLATTQEQDTHSTTTSEQNRRRRPNKVKR